MWYICDDITWRCLSDTVACQIEQEYQRIILKTDTKSFVGNILFIFKGSSAMNINYKILETRSTQSSRRAKCHPRQCEKIYKLGRQDEYVVKNTTQRGNGIRRMYDITNVRTGQNLLYDYAYDIAYIYSTSQRVHYTCDMRKAVDVYHNLFHMYIYIVVADAMDCADIYNVIFTYFYS